MRRKFAVKWSIGDRLPRRCGTTVACAALRAFAGGLRPGGRKTMLHLVSSTLGSATGSTSAAAMVRPEDEAARAGLEATRLAAAERYGVLDAEPEPAFDRITALAAELFQAPVAIIGFIGRDQVFFKSHHGLDEAEAPRGTDPSRSVLEPWIRNKYKYGFHAGVPLDSPDGYEIGTLLVIDRRPRRIEELYMRRLRALAGIVTAEETRTAQSSPLGISSPGDFGQPILHIPFLGSIMLPR